MNAEIISIGDELTSGQRLDTNSQWLSAQLGELGIETLRHTTVGDNLQHNVDAFQLAAARANVIVCTGGLGPTQDDLTRAAIAAAFNRPLQLDEVSLRAIEQLFLRRNRKMPERNQSQAMFPEGAIAIPNPHGSAPGVDLSVEQDGKPSRIFALPGVPAELKEMWHQTVAGRILGDEGRLNPLYYHTLKVFGIGESEVEVRLPELIARDREPTVGITVSRATISLRVAGRAGSHAQFDDAIQPTLEEIRNALGDLIFGEGKEELHDVVSRQLRDQRLTLACVEIGSGNWITDWMSAFPDVFKGGLCLPNLTATRNWLAQSSSNPSKQFASEDGEAEIEDLIRELTGRSMDLFGTDLALVVGEYPSPDEIAREMKAFETYYAIGRADRIRVRNRSLGGHPDVLGPRIAKTGLDMLRKTLANATDKRDSFE